MACSAADNRYVHLGSDVSVFGDDIVGVFDIERLTVKKSVNEFLKRSQKEGRVYYVSLQLPKSFVLADERVFVTNVSVRTLKKRFG